jgi:nitrogenase molybdenum-cofactor synthesis protein NifE
LSRFVQEKRADLLIGGVKERPIAYKLGLGFCDHNHERKLILAGYEGMVNFAREVYSSVCSPVWKLVPGRAPSPESEMTVTDATSGGNRLAHAESTRKAS